MLDDWAEALSRPTGAFKLLPRDPRFRLAPGQQSPLT